MSIPQPYEVNYQDKSYKFTTDNGIFYNISFSDGSFYFANIEPHIPIYELAIKFISLGDYLSPPQDRRAEITIIDIILTFLSDHTNSIIYTCDNIDNRHHARNRKFNIWFNKHQSTDLEKYDSSFVVENTEILASLIVHSQNPFKEALIKVFVEQVNEYRKDE
jgi:Family of unknown function (DUF6169)